MNDTTFSILAFILGLIIGIIAGFAIDAIMKLTKKGYMPRLIDKAIEEKKNRLKKSVNNDLRLRTTTKGPHRDDIQFFIDDFCSSERKKSFSVSPK